MGTSTTDNKTCEYVQGREMDLSHYGSFIEKYEEKLRQRKWTEEGQNGRSSGNLGHFFDEEYARGRPVSSQEQHHGSQNSDPWSMASLGHSLSASDSGFFVPQQTKFVDAPSSSAPGPSSRLVPATVPRQKPPRKHQHPIKAVNTLYKTRMCNKWEEMGSCPYETRCQFAHGVHELRQPITHHLYKTKPCRSFHRTGFCPFGKRCDFLHVDQDDGQHGMDSHLNVRTSGSFDFFADQDDDEPSSTTVITTGFNAKWSTESSTGDSPFSSVQSSRAASPGIWGSSSSLNTTNHSKDLGWYDVIVAEIKEGAKNQKVPERKSSLFVDEFANCVWK